MILLTRICGVSFVVAVAVFPAIKAGGDPHILLSGYGAVLLAAILSALLLAFGAPKLASLPEAKARIELVAAVVFALALALRLGGMAAFYIEPAGDPGNHELAAWNVAQGLGYTRAHGPDPHWPPG